MNRRDRRAAIARSAKSPNLALAGVQEALSKVRAIQQAATGAVQGVSTIEPAMRELGTLMVQMRDALDGYEKLSSQVGMMQHVIMELGQRVEPGLVEKLQTDYWQSQMKETLDAERQG